MIDLQEFLRKSHEEEIKLNRENSNLDEKIRICIHEKRKLAIKISKLVKYRNRMVDLLKNDIKK